MKRGQKLSSKLSRRTVLSSLPTLLIGAAGSTTAANQKLPASKTGTELELPETRITFEARAMWAGRLLPRLGKQASVQLTCDAKLAGEVFVVKVQDRPLSEIMTKLAEAGHAEWIRTENGFHFMRSTTITTRLRRKEVAARERNLRRWFQPIAESLKTRLTPAHALNAIRERRRLDQIKFSGDSAEDSARWEAAEQKRLRLDALKPVYRLIGRCLEEIGFSRLAEMRIGERAVYSTRPTAMQKPLGRMTIQAVALFAEEDALWNEARRTFAANQKPKRAAPKPEDPEQEEAEPERDQDDWSPEFGNHSSLWRNQPDISPDEPPPGPPSRVMIVIDRGLYDSYGLKLTVLNAENTSLLELNGDDFLDCSAPDAVMPEKPEQVEKPDRPEPTITLSRMSILVEQERARIDSREEVRVLPTLNPTVVEWLTHPEENEPLSLQTTDGFFSAAEAKQVNLVACLADPWFQYMSRITGGEPLKVSDFLAKIPEETETEVSIRDSWMMARPMYPLKYEAMRLSRSALGALVRSFAREGKLSTEAFAIFLAQSPDFYEDSLLYTPGWILLRGRHPSTSGHGDLLKLYGSLTPAQRDRLLQGKQVNYNELDIYQRGIAYRIAFDHHINLYSRSGEGAMPEGLGALSEETTEVAPNGLPMLQGIRVKRFQTNYIYLIDPTETGRERIYRTIQMDGLGGGIWTGPPLSGPKGGFDALLCEVHPVTGLHLEADICPWLLVADDYHDEPGEASGPPQSPSSLPEELRKRVEEEIKFLKSRAGEDREPDEKPEP